MATAESRGAQRTIALVFSKDRALQLDAALRSFSACASGEIHVVVLFKATSEEHARDYAVVARENPKVEFLAETDFRASVLELVEGAAWILFAVDDTIFVREFDVAAATQLLIADEKRIGVSLRLGQNTGYCYSYDRVQRLPEFRELEGGWMEFDWTKAELDFGYPLEVSSSVYSGPVIRAALEGATFANPNQLEAALDVASKTLAERFPTLVCSKTSKAFSVPLNKVQTTFENRSVEEIKTAAESFARLFHLGFRVDVGALRNFVPSACHQPIDLPLRPPALEKAVIRGSISVSDLAGEKLSWEGAVDLVNATIADQVLLLEALQIFSEAARQSETPLPTKFLQLLSSDRERVAERELAAQRQRQQSVREKNEEREAYLSDQIQRLNGLLNETVAGYAAAQKSVSELQGSYATLQAIYAELQGAYATLRGSHAELQGSYATLRGSFAELQSSYAETQKMKAQLSALTAEQATKIAELTEQDLRRLDQMKLLAETNATQAEQISKLREAVTAGVSDLDRLRDWLREVENARDWHAERSRILESTNKVLREKKLSEILRERTGQRVTWVRMRAGDTLQKVFRLEKPPQLLGTARQLLSSPTALPASHVVPVVPVETGKPGIVLFMPFLVLGGAERVLSQIVAALDEGGFDLTIVTSVRTMSSQGSAEAWFSPHVRAVVDVSTEPLAVGRARALSIVQTKSIRAVWIAGSELAYDLLPEIKAARPDVKVVDLLFNEVGHTANNRKRAALIDLHVAENRQVAAWLEAKGERAERILTIPNGVDLKQFSPKECPKRLPLVRPDGGLVVGYLGRLSSEKAPDLFLEIAHKLRDEPRLAFYIAGVGPMENELRGKAAQLGIEDRVNFLGAQDARAFLSACDVLVIPSRVDGRPNAALEAMAMGVPVLASRVGGLPEIVTDEVTGWLCEIGAVDQFAARLISAVKNPSTLEGARLAARQKAETELDHRLMLKRYVELFRGLSQS